MKKIDTSRRHLGGNGILFHGIYNVGKTHLLGSALAYEREFGKVVYAHIAGEPSTTSLYSHDLEGVELYTLESVKDIKAFIEEIGKTRLIALDSLRALKELATGFVTKDDHAPGGKAGVTDGRREWGQINWEFDRALKMLFQSCELLLAVCPSSRNENEVTKETYISPDLGGAHALGIAYRFAFVGYIEATTLSPTKTNRTVSFHHRNDALTRCNAPRPITKSLPIAEGTGCWKPIREALETALKGE